MIVEFFSRLHPALVHLPIGILLLALLFAWLGDRRPSTYLQQSVPLLTRTGATAAVLSCASGWILANSGGYEAATLNWHRWLGIATAILAVSACFAGSPKWWLNLAALTLIAAGHFGGMLTHGSEYLSPAQVETSPGPRPPDMQEAALYAEVVSVILKEKCVSCHGPNKKKGGLRLDTEAGIYRGGEHGRLILPGLPDSSLLLHRCLLPPGNEDHMPPREKPQLSSQELQILQWWVASGADFQKKVKELHPGASIESALKKWQKGEKETADPNWVPETPAPAISGRVLAELSSLGLSVMPVGQGNGWLSVSFVNLPNPPDSVFTALEKVAAQVVRLNAGFCRLPESAWNTIRRMKELRRLQLEYSNVADADLAALQTLSRLQYLNLSYTAVGAQALAPLGNLKDLKQLYLYRTPAAASAMDLFGSLPALKIDTGSAIIPFLDSDTARLKAPKAY